VKRKSEVTLKEHVAVVEKQLAIKLKFAALSVPRWTKRLKIYQSSAGGRYD